MNFDDEQMADEKSIANMKLKYAGLNNFSAVKAMQNEDVQETTNLTDVGKLFKASDKYLTFLSSLVSGEAKDFVLELKRLNNLELDELKTSFPSLEELEKLNPQLIFRPRSVYLLNRELAKNELSILSKLFTLFSDETKAEVKTLLKRIILRRIESLGMIFLRPFCVR